MPFDPEKLAALQKKTPVGRAGGIRRKIQPVHKATVQDDKKLKSTLNRLQVKDIPAIEEVNMFKGDGTVIHFVQPKVQAAIGANTYVVAGASETKKITDLVPGIFSQLGAENLDSLKELYAKMAQSGAVPGAGAGTDDLPAVEAFDAAPALVE